MNHLHQPAHASSSKFHSIYTLEEPIWVIDPVSSRFLDANSEAIFQLGFSINEIQKLRVLDINKAVSDEEMWRQLTADMKIGDSVVYGADLQCKSGDRIAVEITLSCQLHDGEKVFVAVTRSQTKSAEICS